MKIKTIFLLALVLVINTIAMARSIKKQNYNTPAWLDSLVASGKYDNNPIVDIKTYTYKNKTVYLVNYDAGCCDQYSAALMDQSGKIICHPYGGISGKGDMQCVDFHKEKTNESVIWVNENPILNSEKKEKSFKMGKS